jgi:prevent-host-death family protein
MEEIAVTKFKASCLSVLERVQKTRQPVRVTRRGKPLADVVPAAVEGPRANWLGCMAGTAHFIGDIVSPSTDEEEWDALRD